MITAYVHPILDAFHDAAQLGSLPVFRDLTSWRAWLVFIASFIGAPLDEEGLAIFRERTGRTLPRPGGYPEALVVCNRQVGKTRIAATIGALEAVLNGRRGERVLLIAQDLRGSVAALMNYVREVFEIPIYADQVARQTADTIELVNGCSLVCYPCRPAAVRGPSSRLVVGDEIAHYQDSDQNPVDKAMRRAAIHTTAMTGGRSLWATSPYGQRGVAWELTQSHYGRDDSPILVWRASGSQMNPLLPADYLERMKEDDPEGYLEEVMGEFRGGTSLLFDPVALEAVTVPGRLELLPRRDVAFHGFCDPSGGRKDDLTIAVGHTEGEISVVDALRAWEPPFNPSGAVAEAADLLRSYGIHRVKGDRYAGDWVAESFRSHGIEYEVAEKDRSALYMELLPLVNSGSVELLDIPKLAAQLRALERRRGTSGKDRIDHPRGGHDDLANAAAGLIVCELANAGRFECSEPDWSDNERLIVERVY